MKKYKVFLVGLVLFFTLLGSFSLSVNTSTSVGSNTETGLNVNSYHSMGSGTGVVQTACGGVSCPLPNSVTNTTI